MSVKTLEPVFLTSRVLGVISIACFISLNKTKARKQRGWGVRLPGAHRGMKATWEGVRDLWESVQRDRALLSRQEVLWLG